MIDTEFYRHEINDLLAMLNGDDYPETYEFLSNFLDIYEKFDAYEIANELTQLDKPNDLPQFILDYIVDLFTACIEDGNCEAMNDLGAQYYEGCRGFEQDFDKAVYYYNMAAEHGCRQAQENLGYCYYYGRTGVVDYEKAFHYFALGAFDGHLISLYKIGDMYAAGYYVKKNEVEAFHIYEHCINTMTDEAAPHVAGPVFLRLGKCFLYGIGTEKNAESALVCYQKAELYLYDMVNGGDVMYKKSLRGAIEGQAKAREILMNELTENQWLDGKKD